MRQRSKVLEMFRCAAKRWPATISHESGWRESTKKRRYRQNDESHGAKEKPGGAQIEGTPGTGGRL